MDIFSVIIPIYNERKSIEYTIDQIRKTEIDQIVCIDDGSTDKSWQIIQRKFPNVTLIRLNSNTGKSNAVKVALNKLNSQYVLLFDADLSNIQPNEINEGLKKVRANPNIDMHIFRRRNVRSKFIKALDHDIIMSGLRIVRYKDLRASFNEFNPQSYEIEMAINQYMIDNNKTISWSWISIYNQLKTEKWGFIKGTLDNLNALKRYFSLLGILGYINQRKFFKTWLKSH